MIQDGIDYQHNNNDNHVNNNITSSHKSSQNDDHHERIDCDNNDIDNDIDHNSNSNEIYERPLTITTSPPSNKKLLCIAFVSFQTFAIVQLTVSIFAGSEAMFGDSIAMMVDALTYLFNLCAERQKEFYAIQLQEQQQQQEKRNNQQYESESEFESESDDPSSSNSHTKPSSSSSLNINNIMVLKHRKYTYQLELIPPLLSVTALLAVTVIVLKESIHILILDSTRDVSLQADPNINIMMIFSFLNLLLDVVNVGCFASAKHAMGYKTNTNELNINMCTNTNGNGNGNDNGNGNKATSSSFRDDESIDNDDENDMDLHSQGIELTKIGDGNDDDHDECDDQTDELFPVKSFGTRPEDNDDDDDDNDTSNLNMCSAYTVSFIIHFTTKDISKDIFMTCLLVKSSSSH
jgi:Co/Zn/Cd efflux system component